MEFFYSLVYCSEAQLILTARLGNQARSILLSFVQPYECRNEANYREKIGSSHSCIHYRGRLDGRGWSIHERQGLHQHQFQQPKCHSQHGVAG